MFEYAVVDLASVPALVPKVFGRLRQDAETLLARDLPPELLAVGPWLVNLTRAAEVKVALAEIGTSLPWGYYVHASIDMSSLRHTLRRFNLVVLPNPERVVLFRYWDPRVMRNFLEVATRQQRARMFEFIDRIEGADSSFVAAAG